MMNVREPSNTITPSFKSSASDSETTKLLYYNLPFGRAAEVWIDAVCM